MCQAGILETVDRFQLSSPEKYPIGRVRWSRQKNKLQLSYYTDSLKPQVFHSEPISKQINKGKLQPGAYSVLGFPMIPVPELAGQWAWIPI